MHYVLIVIAVFNGRFYHEEPQYAVPYPAQQACAVAAAKYPTGGVSYQRAVCVPVIDGAGK